MPVLAERRKSACCDLPKAFDYCLKKIILQKYVISTVFPAPLWPRINVIGLPNSISETWCGE